MEEIINPTFFLVLDKFVRSIINTPFFTYSKCTVSLGRVPQECRQGWPSYQGDAVHSRREQEEHGQDDRSGGQAAGQDSNVSFATADWVGVYKWISPYPAAFQKSNSGNLIQQGFPSSFLICSISWTTIHHSCLMKDGFGLWWIPLCWEAGQEGGIT